MSKIQAFIFGAVIIFCAFSTNAATWTVTKSTNSNDGSCDADCSLREAVATADSGDLIVFDPNLVGQTFTLGGSPIAYVGKRIEIDGNLDGVNVVQLSGSNNTYHFDVSGEGALTIRNMTLFNGNHVNRGSILAFNANLFLDRVVVSNNTSNAIGAIELLANSQKTHSITNSSITSNSTTGGGGLQIAAIHVSVGAVLYMSNTTVSNNRTLGNTLPINDFGAIFSYNQLYLRNCTITANEGNYGGGITLRGGGPGNLFDVGNSIIAGNSAAVAGQDIHYIDPETNIVSRGGNLIGNTDTIPGGIFVQTNDAVNLNPLLAPTNSNQGGHPIITHPLQAGSPALNTGINSVAVNPLGNIPLTNDGRGTGFPRISGGTVDKGAFEDQTGGNSLVVTKLANSNDNVCDTDCSLREAVYAAGQHAGTDNITFALNVFGTMSVGTEIDIENQNVNIIGYPSISSNTLIVSGNNTSRVFDIDSANVTMTGFTIANGNGAGSSQPQGGGGLLAYNGNLTLNQMIIRNNTTAASDLAVGGGGISVVSGGVVRIMNSTINNNSSSASLGAIIDASVIYITNTTIANNSFLLPGEAGRGALSINGTLYMRNSTIANNRSVGSSTGSGLYCGSGSTCNIGNSIFADNSAANTNDLFVQTGGNLTSVGGNLVEVNTGFNNADMTQQNDVIGVDPMLSSLADNGGFVTTMALLPGSPAINMGINSNATDPFSAAALATDARGFMRIVLTVDKGAFESLIPTSATVSVGGGVTAQGAGLQNAIVVLTDSQGIVRTARTSTFGYFKFENVAVGETYVVSVMSKRFQFVPQIVSVTEEITELNFTAETEK